MAIQRNAAATNGVIRDPGEYVVTVAKADVGQSKKGKPMLTVTFETAGGQTIRSYFVADLDFHQEALVNLKLAAGLTAQDRAPALIGKKVGILVEPQPTSPDGKTYMQVAGYGPAANVTDQPPASSAGYADDVPF